MSKQRMAAAGATGPVSKLGSNRRAGRVLACPDRARISSTSASISGSPLVTCKASPGRAWPRTRKAERGPRTLSTSSSVPEVGSPPG